MRRALTLLALTLVATLSLSAPALACGGLIGPNGAVNLVRTTTLAAYHDGVEHYLTAFKFFGAGGQFGSIVPLPGVPTNVERGGAWTLQRLLRETNPVPAALQFRTAAAADAAAKEAESAARLVPSLPCPRPIGTFRPTFSAPLRPPGPLLIRPARSGDLSRTQLAAGPTRPP